MDRNSVEADLGRGGTHVLKVLVASEVRFVRESLGDILNRGAHISIVGDCADRAQTLSICRDLQPDIVLLDALMTDGPATVRQLRERSASVGIVVFAVTESIDAVLVWAEAGMSGYIPSTAATADITAMVDDISAGRQACSPFVAAGLLQRIAAGGGTRTPRGNGEQALTPREFEIVCLVSTGLSNKEIARRLNISLSTTKSHVHSALGKLHAQRRGQVATWMHARSPSA